MMGSGDGSIFTYKGRYEDRQTQLLADLQSSDLPPGASVTMEIAAVTPITAVQRGLIETMLAGKFSIEDVQQRIKNNLKANTPPELGNTEITTAGVPSVGGSAGATAAAIMRAIAGLGIAAALFNFTQQPASVGDEVRKTAAGIGTSLGIPAVLIMGLAAFIVFEWKS